MIQILLSKHRFPDVTKPSVRQLMLGMNMGVYSSSPMEAAHVFTSRSIFGTQSLLFFQTSEYNKSKAVSKARPHWRPEMTGKFLCLAGVVVLGHRSHYRTRDCVSGGYS